VLFRSIAFASGKLVRPVLATKDQLEVAIARYLGRARPMELDLPPEPLEEMQLVQEGRRTSFWN